MKYIRYIMALFCSLSLISDYAVAQEKVYWDVVQQIREEGFERSQRSSVLKMSILKHGMNSVSAGKTFIRRFI